MFDRYALASVTEEQDMLAYDFSSFVAEVGGALGLFLGFSFYLLWEFFKECLSATSKFIVTKTRENVIKRF